jgi:glycosyltransferase involved in cell wall biosynthesis
MPPAGGKLLFAPQRVIINSMRLGYLYSRYPVVSQTFCDSEMLALERLGVDLEVGSIHPPFMSLRHGHRANLRAQVRYAPPPKIVRTIAQLARRDGIWPAALVAEHEARYGPGFKAEQRARNALFFAEQFVRSGVAHFHVHFARNATHTGLFIKAISKIGFSFTAHAQDFMLDVGSDELLREMCHEAAFVVTVSDYSRKLLVKKCPDAAGKIHRVYNGINLRKFNVAPGRSPNVRPRILSVGRLIEFKGFRDLIAACAELKKRGIEFECEIIGDGPLRDTLQNTIAAASLEGIVRLLGALPQEDVALRLADCDVFALASIVNSEGASDILPTVILEAMAVGRPVVSTRLAAIPEMVRDGESGLLVAPRDVDGLARALESLLRDPQVRARFSTAGRRDVEERFDVDKTAAQLLQLFEAVAVPRAPLRGKSRQLRHCGHLVWRWPNPNLPELDYELAALRGGPIHVWRAGSIAPAKGFERLVQTMEFLPDAIVIEAGWHADRARAHEIESWRHELPPECNTADYLEAARVALYLAPELARAGIRHVHATDSRALLCAWILQRLAKVTISATIESSPAFTADVLKRLLATCIGGRISAPEFRAALDGRFIAEPELPRWRRPFGLRAIAVREQFLQQWRDQLETWSR